MTENMNIGIGIVHCVTKATGAGFDVVYKTSDGHWSTLIDDTGDVFRHIRVNNGAIIRMIKFTSDGWYLCSMKQIAGRDEEYRASWIFFPSSIELTSREITTIMEEVERNISKNEYNASALDNIVTRYNSYTINAPKYAVPPRQKGYAIRYVGGGNPSLYDVFGKIYQKTFVNYAWVILMQKEDVEIKEAVDDITSSRLHPSYMIQPPVDEMYGFEPYIGNRIFSNPVRVSDNERISIVWKRDGFLNIRKDGNIPENFSIREAEVYRIIRPSQIKLFDESGRPIRIQGSVSFTPGKWDEEIRGWIVPERKISEIAIAVAANGYMSSPVNRINLSDKAVNEDIAIYLREESHVYRFRVCLDNNRSIYSPEFPVSFPQRLVSCPFTGYRVVGTLREDMLNTLSIDEKYYRDKYKQPSGNPYPGGGYGYDGGHRLPELPEEESSWELFLERWGNVIKWLLIGLVSAAIFFAGYWIFFREEDKGKTITDYTEDYTPRNEKVEKNTIVLDYSKAIDYLDTYTKFKKDEMDSIVGLTGLWDMLNNYEFNRIKSHVNLHPELKQSQRFNDLLKMFDKNPQISGSFCVGDDDVITFENYRKKIKKVLDSDIESGKGDSSNSKTGSTTKKINSESGESGTKSNGSVPGASSDGKSTGKSNSQKSNSKS